jgi:hypothetical protein
MVLKKHSEFVYTSIFIGKHPCVKFDDYYRVNNHHISAMTADMSKNIIKQKL